MTTTLGFTSSSFKILGVASAAPAVVRLRFTADPKVVNPANANDALNPSNYSFSGPHPALVTSIATVVGDPQAVDIFLNVPLASGLWTLTIANTIVADDGGALIGANSINLGVTALSLLTSDVNGGAINDAAENILRKHLPRSFVGTAWDAIIAALAVGDRYNWENAIAAFDQLFVSSALGVFLERRASDRGVTKPQNIGMPDELFQDLTIRISTNKLTQKALLEVLEVFYGTDSVRAYLDSTNFEPYALGGEQSLRISDDNREIEILFENADFAQINKATANEIVASINRQCRNTGFPVYAQVLVDPTNLQSRVRLYSGSLGLASELRVIGGFAQSALAFPTKVSAAIPGGINFSVSVPSPDVARYSITGSSVARLLNVQVGDYAIVNGGAFAVANRGSFVVTDISTIWNGSSYTQYFEVANSGAFVQAGPVTTAIDGEVQFFRPTRAQTTQVAGRAVIVAQTTTNEVDIVLPATTQAVGREDLTAAYLASQPGIAAAGILVGNDGVAHVNFSDPHSFVVGDNVIIDSAVAATAFPILDNQGAGKTASDAFPHRTELDASGLAARTNGGICALSNGAFIVVSGLSGGVNVLDGRKLTVTYDGPSAFGDSIGAPVYSYVWSSIASVPVGVQWPSLDGLAGIMANKALLLGGMNVSGVALSTAQLYDSVANTWTTVPNGTLTARYRHKTVKLVDAAGQDIVVIVGGQTSPTAATALVQKFTSAGGGSLVAHTADLRARCDHAVCAVSSTAFISVGGSLSPSALAATNDCWGFDEATNTAFPVGTMAYARRGHAMFQIGEGRVMVCGGLGRNLGWGGADVALNTSEIYDKALGMWTPGPPMPVARSFDDVVIFDGKAYLTSSLNTGGGTVVYDIKKGTWEIPAAMVTDPLFFTGNTVSNGAVALGYGSSFGNERAFLFVDGAIVLGRPSINGSIFKIASVSDEYNLTFNTSKKAFTSYSGAVLTPVAAVESTQSGPYIWSPDEGPAVTEVTALLQTSLLGGRQYRSITVDNASAFPDAPGWLNFAFGTDESTIPVKYLGRISGTEISLDYGHVFEKTLAAGTIVTLLLQKGPYDPADAATLGSFYLTGSSAGRVAAQQAIEDITAAGATVNIEVQYPSDKGLGNAGGTGMKISDKVVVWGGDDVDAELEALRQELEQS